MEYNLNPYSYDNLTAEDKRFVDGIQYAMTVVQNTDAVINDFELTDKDDILSRIKKEIIEEVLENVSSRIETTRSDIIIHLISHYTK